MYHSLQSFCSPIAVPVPVAVGMESGVIAHNQLTSSSQQGPEYGAQYSRLNSRSGGGAWCAGSCDSSEYLQIDLGKVYLIFEVSYNNRSETGVNFISHGVCCISMFLYKLRKKRLLKSKVGHMN